MKNAGTDSLIYDLAVKAAEQLSLELVHTEVVGRSGGQVVRVFIDAEDGITHDNCAAMSQSLEALLDQEDPIEDAYTLEVSSPGIERGLFKIEDFQRFSGENAKVKTHRTIEGQKNFRGKIKGVDGNVVKIEDRTNGLVEIDFDLIRKANLEFDLNKELKGRRK